MTAKQEVIESLERAIVASEAETEELRSALGRLCKNNAMLVPAEDTTSKRKPRPQPKKVTSAGSKPSKALAEDVETVRRAVCERDLTTTAEIVQFCDITAPRTRAALAVLVERGTIVRAGEKRGTKYFSADAARFAPESDKEESDGA